MDEDEYRDKAREYGKLGGRPSKVDHDPFRKGCRCVECRKLKGWAPYGGKPKKGIGFRLVLGPKKVDKEFDFGA